MRRKCAKNARNGYGTKTGRIVRIEDYGSIILILVKQRGGQIFTVPADRRSFGYIIEAEGNIIGRKIKVGRDEENLSVEFLD